MSLRKPLLIVLSFLALGSLAVQADEAEKKETSDKKQTTRKTRADWAEIKLKGSYPEGTQLPGLFGDMIEGLPTCLDRLQQAAKDRSIKGVLLRDDGVEIGWAD